MTPTTFERTAPGPFCFAEMEDLDQWLRLKPTFLGLKVAQPDVVSYPLVEQRSIERLHGTLLAGMDEHEAFLYEPYLRSLPGFSTFDVEVALADQLVARRGTFAQWLEASLGMLGIGPRYQRAVAFIQALVDGGLRATDLLDQFDWGAPGRQHRTIGRPYD